MAASVVRRLDAAAFGLGGTELARAGAELVCDLRPIAAMGIAAVAARAPSLARAVAALVSAARARRPRAALLVGFSELNARLSPWLRRRGVRVLWYAPPQVWAWRLGRAPRLARGCDRIAVLLPFEAATWSAAGASVEYVGHPALDRAFAPAPDTAFAAHVALLPGSRPHGLAPPPASIVARIVRAPSLDDSTSRWIERAARNSGTPVTDAPLDDALRGCAAAIVASGTATLECAVAGVPPVIVYRTDCLTYAIARRLVRVSHVGLPNLVLGWRAFPELLQSEVRGERIATALSELLSARAAHIESCRTTRAALSASLDERGSPERVAAMLRPWLD